MPKMSEDAFDTHGQPLTLTFFVALPSPCPVEHGTIVSRTFDEQLRGYEHLEIRSAEGSHIHSDDQKNKVFASLKFWQVKSPTASEAYEPFFQVISEVTGKFNHVPDLPPDDPPEGFRTVVEMVTAENSESLRNGSNALNEAFGRCFSLLSEVFSMSRLVRHHGASTVTAEQVGFSIWYGRLPGEEYGDRGGILYITPPPAPPSDTFDRKEFSKLEVHLARLWNGSPIELVMDRALDAYDYLHRSGDYTNAVIHAALSSEILLDSTLGLLLWEEQLAAPDFSAAAGIFDDSRGGLATRVKRDYCSRLGGTWDPGVRGPVKQWKDDLARLRGRAVHRGYRPSRDETVAALGASDGLLEFIKFRLAQNARNYPRTALMILGEPGLRRLGGWKSVRNGFETTGDDVLSWFADYSRWRAAVDAL
ncbi:hypothetical protein [Streptomyces niveus]|uniref:hypothetical protein n=1 Tax=Streptomyces niveus TaxID=193462 RepID=UPI0033A44908